MIATVILGLGLVMVATVFPIAVEQTRSAIQNSIVRSVADSAIETIKLRMQTVRGTDSSDANTSDFPGDRPHDTDGESALEDPILPSEYDTDPSTENLIPLPSDDPRSFRVLRSVNMSATPNPAAPNTDVQFLAGNGVLYDGDYESILGIGSQFSLGTPGSVVPDRSPRIKPSWWPGNTGSFPKIDVLDRVYPPVVPSDAINPMNNAAGLDYPRFQDLVAAANRRYCWMALGAPSNGTIGPEGGPYRLRILVMFRANLTDKFAAQNAAPSGGFRHARPVPLTADDDTLFPQPWLVKFGDDNDSTMTHVNYTAEPTTANLLTPFKFIAPGTVICRNEVGDLLPPGSIFIDFELGKPHEVLQNVPYSEEPNDHRLLILAPDPNLNGQPNTNLDGMKEHYPDFPDYAWVIPPPIVRTGTGDDDYYFDGGSPLLAVFEAEVPRR